MKICVIGAGISGCGFLCHFARLKPSMATESSVICFEKQRVWGGIWNYDWRTGTDEFGEPVHCSMYQNLWVNQPKETMEFSDYTYDDHFGRAIPSFPPRGVIADYLNGRWQRNGIQHLIKFSHLVQRVKYDESRDDFIVVVKDLIKDVQLPPIRFTHVIVANGHYSVPNCPSFPGLDTFPGRLLHSHELRDFRDFAEKRVLLVGGNISVFDVSLQCLKYGSSQVVVSSRSDLATLEWLEGVELRPLLSRVRGDAVDFDDETMEFDVIILCTGYLHSYPFMSEELRLKTDRRVFALKSLYKMCLFLDGGNNKLFYLGMTHLNILMFFEESALWTVNVILGNIKLPTLYDMKEETLALVWEEDKCKTKQERFRAKIKLITEMKKESGSPLADIGGIFSVFEPFWKDYKNRFTFRNRSYTSYNTGRIASNHHTKFMEEFDDTLENFVKKSLGPVQKNRIP